MDDQKCYTGTVVARRDFPVRLALSPLKPPVATRHDVERLVGVLQVVPYNTPVRRFGVEYRLIRDAHGGCMVTQDGVIVAGGNISQGELQDGN